MTDLNRKIEEICQKDKRYKPDGYEFVIGAFNFTRGRLKRQGHISGKELSMGCAEYAISLYGPMVRSVMTHWGIAKTQDFGNIVFNLIDAKLFSKTESDSADDFRDVYDFSVAFGNVLDRLAAAKKPCKVKR